MQTLVVDDVPQIGPYSHAAQSGPWVFTAGMGGVDPQSGEVVSDDVIEQTDQAIRNTEVILKAVGCALGDVLKVTLYLTDPADYERVNRAYSTWFGDHRPARTCIVAASLPARERVKLETIARSPEES